MFRRKPGERTSRWRRSIAAAVSVLGLAGLVGLSPTPAQANVAVNIHNYFTAKCVDLPGYGTPKINDPVSQYDCNYSVIGDNQSFYRVQVGDDSGGPIYYFQTYKGGWCLDAPGYGADPAGTHLEVYPCQYGNPSADNQGWHVQPVYSGAYEIINVKSGLCLDVSGWNPASDQADDLPLTLYPCYNPSWGGNGYDDHLWSFAQSTGQ